VSLTSLEAEVEGLMSSRWNEPSDATDRQRERSRERVCTTADRGMEALFHGGTDRDIETTDRDLEATRGIDAVYVRRYASYTQACVLHTSVNVIWKFIGGSYAKCQTKPQNPDPKPQALNPKTRCMRADYPLAISTHDNTSSR
jgi:hypothetical protein